MTRAQWLKRLESRPGYYQELLDGMGGKLHLAAYHLARVRCGLDCPTTKQVHACARELFERCPLYKKECVPSLSRIGRMCAADDLPVTR